jgi:hypothetical protein
MPGTGNKRELVHALVDAEKKTVECTKENCNSGINFILIFLILGLSLME